VRVLRSTMARIESPEHPLLAKRPEETFWCWCFRESAGWPALQHKHIEESGEFTAAKRKKSR